MTSEKPYWFELAEGDQAPSRPEKIKRNFPLFAALSLGVVALGGSLLLNTSDEPTASAASTTSVVASKVAEPVTQSSRVVVATQNTLGTTPAIAPVVVKISNTAGDDQGRERENNDD